MSNFKDLSNQKFGCLIPLSVDKNKNYKKTHWICKCDCGNITIVSTCDLTSGHTKSCGCLKFKSKNQKHGMKNTRIYNIWCSMKQRCNNKNCSVYKSYGAKGISVCPEWNSNFISFYNWSISNGYKDNLTIDRLDNSKGYSPENCRWATAKQQARNRISNIIIEHNGESKILIEWCEKYNVRYSTVYDRLVALRNKNEEITFEKLFKEAL